jgi:phosphoribosylglycinamide formyltransferase-1
MVSGAVRPQSDAHSPQATRPLCLGVLVSGRGTNLQAILDAIAAEQLNAEVALVVSNHADAYAVERATAAGVPVEVHERAEYPSRLAKQLAIARRFDAEGVDLVVCAGWDRVFKEEFVERFAGRIINVHPSLLPAFGGGLHAIRDALHYGVKLTGCTVHFVTNDVDAGPIICQAAVPVLPGDNEQTLAQRIHIEEHRLLVEAIRLFGQERLRLLGRVVEILPQNA